MQNMQAGDTIKVERPTSIVIRTTRAKADEFYRLSRQRHGRSGQQQGERILTEWIAAEQAAEAADAQEAAA